MHMMHQIEENAMIARLAALLPHQPAQLNGLNESDAELIRVPGAVDHILAVTTDTITEEIESGLYDEPYLIGWMTVMANLSDLAAVGADPIGVLVAETLPRGASEEDLAALQSGIRDACMCSGAPVLGGDTNFSDRLHTTGTAIGLVSDSRPMKRVHCRPDELLYCTGPLGGGNALAALRVLGNSANSTFSYRPIARIKEGVSLRPYASVCMDTSDGLLAALDQLGRLNNCGFALNGSWEMRIAPEARSVASNCGLSPWMLLAGPHGEFELVFTVTSHKTASMHQAAELTGWEPICLGIVTHTPGIELAGWGRFTPEDLAAIRNYRFTTARERQKFPQFLAEIARGCGISTEP
jgi:thiamine-monophosphate kinase